MTDAFEKPLPEIFRDAAAALQDERAFKWKLCQLVVLVDSSLEPVYLSPGLVNELSGNTQAVKRALAHVLPPDQQNIGGRAARGYVMGGVYVDLIALRENARAIYSSGYTEKMHKTAFFYHELGHMIVPNGTGDHIPPNLKEMAAEAYAALSHVRLFGKDTEFFDYYNRAHTIVLGLSKPHYTDAVIQKVKQLSQERDLSALSETETVELAGQLALQCQVPQAVLNKIANAYEPVNDAALKNFNSREEIVGRLYTENDPAWKLFFRETLAVMREHRDDKEIFEAGRRFLGHPSRRRFMEERAETEPDWRDALDFIDNHVPVTRRMRRQSQPLPA